MPEPPEAGGRGKILEDKLSLARQINPADPAHLRITLSLRPITHGI